MSSLLPAHIASQVPVRFHSLSRSEASWALAPDAAFVDFVGASVRPGAGASP